ncbi:response regulator transcription factor [Cohnella nanjingensis]|uniref:Response regulator transcription factor n=1 Tax=Cohnella nanjingensis TaxID=1387779 RepID=A0A7X0RU71_9BACL|nr:response regulator transcription factor [Cohnella nanjingensis]MBB6673670.1 response regulator transcription factor [Cohnella nanjingensis]
MEKPVHIMVVEDDDDINRLLCSVLRKSGYVPQPAYSGTEALLYLEKQKWNMILLDLMLPGLSGEELLNRIGKYGSIPVLILSAKEERQTKIDMLRTGADDYITKPFDIEEVSARIDSHLRRYRRVPTPAENQLLKHKNAILDLDAKKVTVGGSPLSLTAREYDILALLMTSPKKLFTKANVFESVWDEAFIGGEENTINVHVSNLRSKLSKADPGEEYIETIWGMGYRLKA